MAGLKFASYALIVGLCAGTAAHAQQTRTAISCAGEAIQDFKSFNLPSKTVPQTRLYVIDTIEKSIAMVSDGDLVPLCDKGKPACRADFLPAGIRIDYHEGEDTLKLIFNRGAMTLGEQSENATLMTTFEGHCQPADLPAAAPAK